MLRTCVVCVRQKRQSDLWQNGDNDNFLSQKIQFSLSIQERTNVDPVRIASLI